MTSLNVFPSHSSDDGANGGLLDSELKPYFSLGNSRSVHGSDIANYFGSKFGGSYAFTLRRLSSSFRVAVGSIIHVRSKKKVIGSDAQWSVTLMADKKSVRNFTVGHLPTDSVYRTGDSVGLPAYSIPTIESSFCPEPASGSFVNPRPETWDKLFLSPFAPAFRRAKEALGMLVSKERVVAPQTDRWYALYWRRSGHVLIVQLAFALLLLFSPVLVEAQTGNTLIIRFSGAPSGSCAPFMIGINNATGALYDCVAGVWTLVGGGGGGAGTVTNVLGTANQITSDGSTTTPTLSIPSTFIAPGTIAATTTVTGTQLISSVATGTAPLTVTSTTNVANLNASSLGGATFAAPGAIGGGTAAAGTFTAGTFSGILTDSQAGALSASAVSFTGAPVTGGTGTTTFPLAYLNSGAAPTTWSTSGTVWGINAPSGFAGNFLDLHLNGGTSLFSINQIGTIANTGNTVSGGFVVAGLSSILGWSTRGGFTTPGDGVITAQNNAANGFTRLNLGGTTTSFPALGRSGTTLTTQLADGSAGGTFSASNYATVANCSSSASPAVCAAANAGSVVVAAAATTVVVNTTAVTANSQIFLMYDSSLGTKLSVTCNTTEPALYGVTARTAATSFTITATSPVTNPACFSYFIVN